MAYPRRMTSLSGTPDKPSAGDPLPSKCSVIEVHVGELKQLFNAIDPSPFRDKDLDPKAEEFIVGWAKDLPRDATLALVVDLDREAGLAAVAFLPQTRRRGGLKPPLEIFVQSDILAVAEVTLAEHLIKASLGM